MAELKATRSILYLNRLYQAGETLPCTDTTMVAAWLDAGSARWHDQQAAPSRTPEPEPELQSPSAPVRKTRTRRGKE